MSDQSKRIRATRIAGLMSCVLAAGCTGLERSPPQPAQPATEPVSVAPAVPADVPATQPVAAPRDECNANCKTCAHESMPLCMLQKQLSLVYSSITESACIGKSPDSAWLASKPIVTEC
jgi:hypothetical protein